MTRLLRTFRRWWRLPRWWRRRQCRKHGHVAVTAEYAQSMGPLLQMLALSSCARCGVTLGSRHGEPFTFTFTLASPFGLPEDR